MREKKIFLAGHNGMLGKAIHKSLMQNGFNNIISEPSKSLDLRDVSLVQLFFEKNRPNIVIIAAAKVGGINANINYPGDFLNDNLMIQCNLMNASKEFGVELVIFPSSSCIYPKESLQPMTEDYILSGKLEPTNEGYALAKITGMKMLEYFHKQYQLDSIIAIPCNLYGPNDSFNLEHSHVLSALIKKFIDAENNKESSVTMWGTGIAKREFMHVEDAANAIVFLMLNDIKNQVINIGTGKEISIKELAELIKKNVGFQGEINWDNSKPDGMLRKCLDVSKMINLGFRPKVTLQQGINEMINIYKNKKI